MSTVLSSLFQLSHIFSALLPAFAGACNLLIGILASYSILQFFFRINSVKNFIWLFLKYILFFIIKHRMFVSGKVDPFFSWINEAKRKKKKASHFELLSNCSLSFLMISFFCRSFFLPTSLTAMLWWKWPRNQLIIPLTFYPGNFTWDQMWVEMFPACRCLVNLCFQGKISSSFTVLYKKSISWLYFLLALTLLENTSSVPCLVTPPSWWRSVK